MKEQLLKQLKSYKKFKDVPLFNKKSYNNMKYIIKKIDKINCLRPELFPWCDFYGFQLEWEYNGKYLEIETKDTEFGIYYEQGSIVAGEYTTTSKKDIIHHLKSIICDLEFCSKNVNN